MVKNVQEVIGIRRLKEVDMNIKEQFENEVMPLLKNNGYGGLVGIINSWLEQGKYELTYAYISRVKDDGVWNNYKNLRTMKIRTTLQDFLEVLKQDYLK